MSKSARKKKRKGTIWMCIGLLLIMAALFLTCYNVWDEYRANHVRIAVLEELEPEIEEKEAVLDYKKFPDMEMPEMVIEGNRYIGVLKIPSLKLDLPIMSEWSYPKLKIAPCRYEGSAYLGNLIIAAHNYDCHFGSIKLLVPGEEVSFTDADGNEFFYEVAEVEILEPYAIEEMKSGDWDLTLFTCTYGGKERVTVRCVSVE